jgi:Kef-type K+ transport system membrane component KefB
MNALDITLIYLLAAVTSVVVCRLLHWPAMLGYLLAGILLGHAFNEISPTTRAWSTWPSLGLFS